MSTEIKTIKDVIKCVLVEAGGVPLHYEDIREIINQRGLYKKNIEKITSIKTTLSRDSDFELVGEGKYKLKNHIVQDNLVKNFLHEACTFAFDVNTQIDKLYQSFQIWGSKKPEFSNISKDDFIRYLSKEGIDIFKIDPNANNFNCLPGTYADAPIDENGFTTVASRIFPKSIFNGDFISSNELEANSSFSKISSVIERNVIDNQMGYWKESRVKISITGNLRDKILEEGDCHTFCRGISIVNNLLNDWHHEPFALDYLHRFDYRRDLKVIFGTKEEVIEHRKKFKNTNSDALLSEINKLKLELINQISSEEMYNNINEIQMLFNKLRRKCTRDQISGRYAFYRPIKCKVAIDTYPVFLLDKEYDVINNQEMGGYGCHIHNETYSFESDFIMMPYDLEDSSDLVFSPKFYQALYHELYHFIVYDRYRASEKINEGFPELYSEICYKKFLHDFISTKVNDHEIDEFFEEYMRFQYEGSYKPYYDFVKDKMVNILQLNEDQTRSYETFCEFISRLINSDQEVFRESNPKYMNERDIILDCKEQTPKGDEIFEQTLRQFEKYY
ncbi:MAG: HTH domain-containing protein [Methanosarcina sp.]|uniref:HTH domain-containing protein n=1 Tax=Methanosarcina sp. TaxID=2213 RepID=UPI0026128D08|nr:HTH domain-containing protein [Methanosarcina sp.]MDD3247493.1 HTH domain-containing protein [Methanosarcina sp.]MDD4247742.1 HTH domain-containing protein [Methanosarcina sp.]